MCGNSFDRSINQIHTHCGTCASQLYDLRRFACSPNAVHCLCVGVWVSECVSVWVCACMCMCICVRIRGTRGDCSTKLAYIRCLRVRLAQCEKGKLGQRNGKTFTPWCTAAHARVRAQHWSKFLPSATRARSKTLRGVCVLCASGHGLQLPDRELRLQFCY